jgi:hypothetical protein
MSDPLSYIPHVPDLRSFMLSDMVELSPSLRRCARSATTTREAGTAIVRFLRDAFVESDGTPQIALARLYRTARYADLSPELQAFAAADGPLDPSTTCLVLVASAGDLPEWNDPDRSVAHRAIALRSTRAVADLPMVARLLEQFDATEIVSGDARALERRATFDVFHVEDPHESPYVPAKDFVRDRSINSVVGFGGYLPPQDLFAVVLFCRPPMAATTAEMFSSLGLSAKLALLDRVQDGVLT